MLVLALQAGLQIDYGFACFDQCRQFLARRIVGLARRIFKRLGEPGDHLCIDDIVLGEPPRGSGEVAHSLWIDDPHLEAGFA